jgi:DNA-binding HxlR family transcriptional regulator
LESPFDMRVARAPHRVAEYSCSLEVIVAVLGGKWKPGILFNLLDNPMRFTELRRRLGVSEKVLTQQLRELAGHGVVARSATRDVPPQVTYSLTTYGRTLRPILERMGRWGETHLARLRKEHATPSPPSITESGGSRARRRR